MQKTDATDSGKLFLPALIIAFFAVTLSVPMLSILTVDISQTFFGNTGPIAVGQVTQVTTINRVFEVLFALAMGALTIRFKSKPLLLMGVMFLFISGVGSFLAPTILWLQFFYALEGGGSVIVAIMAFTLIGEWLSAKDKPKAVSYLNAAGFGAILIASPAISVITNIGGWKLNYVWLVLPLSLAGLALAYIGVPARQVALVGPKPKQSYYEGYKQVFRNKSAVSCLIAGLCGTAGNLAVFSIAYYRQQFLSNSSVVDQVNFSTVILMVAAALFIVATVVMGRLLNRINAVTATVIGIFGNGAFTLLFFLMQNLPLAITMHMLQIWFFAMAVTPWSLLTLDQVPAFRGTMMSLRSIVLSIGSAIATGVGGLALIFLSSYAIVGVILGVIILLGSPLIYFFTKDPSKIANR